MSQSVPDIFVWKAHYSDGTALDEYTPDGHDHGFREVDLDRLVAFELIPQRDGLPTPHVRIEPGSGKRPIFFRRRSRIVNPNLGDAGPGPVYHCIGWQLTTPEGRNVKSFCFFFEDGSVLLTDDFKAV